MGVSPNGFVLAGKLSTFAAGVAAVPKVGTEAACAECKTIMLAALASAGVQSRRLRNVRSGARLGVHYRVVGAGTNAVGVVKATGPWQLIEEDTRAHTIDPRSDDLGAAMKFPGARGDNRGGFAQRVRHPGTTGRHPWRNGEQVFRRVAPKVYETAVGTALAASFR